MELQKIGMSAAEYSRSNKKLLCLRDEKALLMDEWESLIAISENNEDGEFTDEQAKRYTELEKLVTKVNAEMGRQNRLLDEERNMQPVRNRDREQVERERQEADRAGAYGSDGRQRQTQRHNGGAVAFQDMATGKEVLAFSHGESITAALSDLGPHFDLPREGEFSIGRVIAGRALNRMDIMTPYEIEASGGAYGGSGTAGGYNLNPAASMAVYDLARSASRVSQAGARVITMPSREMTIARITGDPDVQWRAEGVAINASRPTFDRATLRARTLAGAVPITIELLEDAANMPQVIEDTLRTALSQELDRAALLGAAAGEEPTGIVNTTGIDEQSSVGTPDDYTEISAAILAIKNANYPGMVSNLAWLANPRDFATYDGLTDTTGQPLMPTPWASQLQKYDTTKLAIDGSSETTMVVGAFSELVIGMRSGIRIEILREGTITDTDGDSHNATSEMKIIVRVHMRGDVLCLRPTWFSKLTGVTA